MAFFDCFFFAFVVVVVVVLSCNALLSFCPSLVMVTDVDGRCGASAAPDGQFTADQRQRPAAASGSPRWSNTTGHYTTGGGGRGARLSGDGVDGARLKSQGSDLKECFPA